MELCSCDPCQSCMLKSRFVDCQNNIYENNILKYPKPHLLYSSYRLFQCLSHGNFDGTGIRGGGEWVEWVYARDQQNAYILYTYCFDVHACRTIIHPWLAVLLSWLTLSLRKTKWWRGWFWFGDDKIYLIPPLDSIIFLWFPPPRFPPPLVVNWQSNLYSPPLYSVGNDWSSVPLENHVISQKSLPPRAIYDECSPIPSYFNNFSSPEYFFVISYYVFCFVSNTDTIQNPDAKMLNKAGS